MKSNRIKFTKKFRKQYQKAPEKIRKQVDIRMAIFIRDKFSEILYNHALIGQWRKYRIINVTGDWRAIYIKEEGAFVFVALGTHSQLYS